MRTTLDLDTRVLAAARALADQERTSLGAAVSELASNGRSKASERRAATPDKTQPHPPSAADDATHPAETATAPGAGGRATADEASEGRRDSGGDRRP